MKKTISFVVATILTAGLLSACGVSKNDAVTVVSREDGSGTRGAFIELVGIEQKGSDGTKTDLTTKEAVVVNKTDVMLQTVAGDPNAIGYVSLGSLGSGVRALHIGGVEATTENVKNASYPVSRAFLIATKGTPNEVAQDYIQFILSREGQAVISASYTPINDAAPAFVSSHPVGRCVIAGSSSVSPVMEKLAEAYAVLNPEAKLEIQTSDSTAGMTAAIDGICDIGMASRELKNSEREVLTGIPIALDGIAVIVHPDNPCSELTLEQVRDLYTGAMTQWSAIVQ